MEGVFLEELLNISKVSRMHFQPGGILLKLTPGRRACCVRKARECAVATSGGSVTPKEGPGTKVRALYDRQQVRVSLARYLATFTGQQPWKAQPQNTHKHATRHTQDREKTRAIAEKTPKEKNPAPTPTPTPNK